ncbi:hypothetical protein [Bradyrhizobium ivorense]|uniref:hypothetical protein n=1 Tax=Bradyrhizobium ivorense TaxID=2511166 RepID=UPI0010B6077F|nr:hypothetical protein [Bradyrhizobium ivorense]VIO77382.1 hypothetical protein CI41S_56370 [Bradyrhizobium ivorense]
MTTPYAVSVGSVSFVLKEPALGTAVAVSAGAVTFKVTETASPTAYAISVVASVAGVRMPALGASYSVSGYPSAAGVVPRTLPGVFSVLGNETHFYRDFINWLPKSAPTAANWTNQSNASPVWTPVPTHNVAFLRPDATQDVFRVFTRWGYGEFQLTQIIPAAWELNGARAVENGKSTILVPYDAPSVWEFAGKIGGGGEAEATFNFFGGAHGNISKVSRTILVDGIDKTNMRPSANSIAGGNSVTSVQLFNILLPRDNSVICGTMLVKHTFDLLGCLVEVALNPKSGFEWYNNYTAMLPSGGFDRITFGERPAEAPLHPAIAATRDRGSQFASYVGTNTAHSYGVRMTLPFRGPNITGSWADSGADCAFWIDQTIPKIYVTDISTTFSERKTAFPRSSATRYQIFKQGVSGPPSITPPPAWTLDPAMLIPPPDVR